MRKLSLSLARIDRIGHALYADDITIWCTGGRDGDVEDSLQQALRCTEEFLDNTGLHLLTAISELLQKKNHKMMCILVMAASTIILIILLFAFKL
uniref:Tick transposon n=1 Tax=Rhipicephalus zambeziensis TaxID=60191 RepID=A0A224Z5Z6_9ACAR